MADVSTAVGIKHVASYLACINEIKDLAASISYSSRRQSTLNAECQLRRER
jgi:hypothetical protein